MALTIHAPHLPHFDDWARHRTMMIGIAAVAFTAGTVYVVQQQTTDLTSSAPAATAATELRAGPSRSGAGAIARAPGADPALPDTGEFLGLEIGPAAAAAALPDTGEFLGLDTVPGTVADSAPAVAASSAFRSGHLLPGTGTVDSAPAAAAVDTGEFLGLDSATAAVGSSASRSGRLLR